MTRMLIGNNLPYGLDMGVDAYRAAEARSKGDVAGVLMAYGCPENIARMSALREEYRSKMKPQTREDHDLIERMVQQRLLIDKDKVAKVRKEEEE
jgi:hypothetical protein